MGMALGVTVIGASVIGLLLLAAARGGAFGFAIGCCVVTMGLCAIFGAL